MSDDVCEPVCITSVMPMLRRTLVHFYHYSAKIPGAKLKCDSQTSERFTNYIKKIFQRLM